MLFCNLTLVFATFCCVLLHAGHSRCTDIRIGFLTKYGSKTRFRSDRGEDGLRQVLYHSISEINQTSISNQEGVNNSDRLNYHVHVASTDGKESESIKQTIDLITKNKVDVIIGPHETCQIEAQIAAIYNVAMVSYFCPLPNVLNPDNPWRRPTTFIQTKPPYWRIVQKVAALVGQLLECNHCYPQQLVLLYYKNPATSSVASPFDNRLLLDSFQAPRTSRQITDAIQYKLIGELLEVNLRELFVVGNGGTINSSESKGYESKRYSGGSNGSGKNRKLTRQLSVLNWHTTYHHGWIENPFRKIIRRHLYSQKQQQIANLSQQNSSSINYDPNTFAPKSSQSNSNEMAAIYIIVGNRDQHLGLMHALDEWNLIGHRSVQSTRIQLQQQQHQSMLINSSGFNQQQSLVIGVDFEPFDEISDSNHFFKGLLDGNQHLEQSDAGLDLLASKYSNYLGVVPYKPTQTDKLQDSIRASRNNTSSSSTPSSSHKHFDNLVASMPFNSDSNLTVESLLPAADLFKLIRLPIEAYYLYDSVLLIGSYFSECFHKQRLPISECSNGTNIFNWFANHSYLSSLNLNMTKFDSQAQTDGFYTMITRRPLNNSMTTTTATAATTTTSTGELDEDDFGIIQLGLFEGDAIEILVDSNQISPIWLPFWCKLKQSNSPECKSISCINHPNTQQSDEDQTSATFSSSSSTSHRIWLTIVGLLLLMAFCLLILHHLHATSYLKQSFRSKSTTESWFNESDEHNFLHIVSELLHTPQISSEGSENLKETMLNLHCYMFPFPSCKFVHWLIALHQLKEMMFQFQASNLRDSIGKHENNRPALLAFSRDYKLSKLMGAFGVSSLSHPNANNRAFFVAKHKGSGSLRLLLHKYKAINECLCTLSQLNHSSIVQLLGATLVCNVNGTGGKEACLIVEKSDRGNLRLALKTLDDTLQTNNLDKSACFEFKELLLISLLDNLLDGLAYLHQTKLQFHGELRATTCMVTVDWRLKLSGFQVHHMRRSLGEYEHKLCADNADSYMKDLVYSAPEVLISHNRRSTLTGNVLKLADIYSFAFVLYELFVGHEPWECLTQVTNSKLLVERAKVDSSFRPPLLRLDKRRNRFGSIDLDVMKETIRLCWSHSPELRPQSIEILRSKLASITSQLSRLSPASRSQSTLLSDTSSVNIMSLYAKILERICVNCNRDLSYERHKSDDLQHSLLPGNVVAKLRLNQPVPSISFDCVSFCLFRFIILNDSGEQDSLIVRMNEIFTELDKLVGKYRGHIHLLDSQVDSSLRFMVYSGDALLNETQSQSNRKQIHHHVGLLASFALQLVELTNSMQTNSTTNYLQVKCALHCGPAIGGLSSLGCRNPSSCLRLSRYILYGSNLQLIDTLEMTSSAQRIQMSSEFRSQLLGSKLRLAAKLNDITGSCQEYVIVRREAKLYAKNLGEFEAYWLLNGPRLSESQSLMLQPPEAQLGSSSFQ